MSETIFPAANHLTGTETGLKLQPDYNTYKLYKYETHTTKLNLMKLKPWLHVK